MNEQVTVTQSLLSDLMEGIQHRAYAPAFGEVYLGVSRGFGQGVDHYGMVRGDLEGRVDQPLTSFAPITSEKEKRNGVMVLDKGVLPPKKGVGLVPSYVLLFWPAIRVPVRVVKDRFRKRLTLPQPFQEQARRIIAELSA